MSISVANILVCKLKKAIVRDSLQTQVSMVMEGLIIWFNLTPHLHTLIFVLIEPCTAVCTDDKEMSTGFSEGVVFPLTLRITSR